MESWEEMVERIKRAQREKKRPARRLESEKDKASFEYSLKNASRNGSWLPLVPRGKDDRPAEKLLKGKVRGKKRWIGRSI